MSLIEMRDVTKVYEAGELRVPVLNGVTLAIEAGEFVALMGSSGSGKTTLMNILGFLDRPTSGSYRFDGCDVSRMSRRELARLRNERVGFVFQNFSLLPRMSALDNVLLPFCYALPEVPDGDARARAIEMLRRVGLADRIDHMPGQLSGGQQQRVAIARALVNRPAVLLADEPTGNLDSRTSGELLRMLETLNRDDEITIVFVTHDAEIARHAARTIRIKDGVIETPAARFVPELIAPRAASLLPAG